MFRDPIEHVYFGSVNFRAESVETILPGIRVIGASDSAGSVCRYDLGDYLLADLSTALNEFHLM